MAECKVNFVNGWESGSIIATGVLTFTNTCIESHIPEIKKIIYNGDKTVVLWQDGTKTVSSAGKTDIPDPEVGLAMCVMKKLFGNKVYGRKLYRRMILGAEFQGDLAKEMLEEYHQEVKNKENDTKEKKKNRK